MKDKIFVDTNIWLYAFMDQDSPKSTIAREIIENNIEKICLSVQVLNEICINLLKKVNYSEEQIKVLIKNLDDTFEIYPIRVEDSITASEIREKFYISFWDSLIVASALNNECNLIYSEDMQNNQEIEKKLKIINPFVKKNAI
ncbi:PIN domain-containing protein [Sulfurihydrogenibium azorense]|uniref:PIN domain-containing protein n=1 Tax=Sulfurihydrogenibium azorense TaxID=309806 RepID=UPI00240A0D48|nr:PIN domain-containing protein [Sulfurihydrogenibium azorense]MDM7272963.1 PIN domain-containing protein [Sulfurihydrogenibium azorense]